jgi:hypothetical protein
MYLKLSMHLLGLKDFDGGKSISWFKIREGRENLEAQIALALLDFQGSPLLMALEMDFPASKSLRPTSYKQQVH